MSTPRWPLLLSVVLSCCALVSACLLGPGALAAPGADDPSPPAAPVKLIFIHHSTGQNWLSDDDGGLGAALGANNYFVSDTNYGWGPDSIGDRTDIPNWPEWFSGPESAAYMAALFAESDQHSGYSRPIADPGGTNRIVMFKSCFPNSNLEGEPDDPPLPAPNGELSVANAKAVYNDILTYFATRQDKLFVVITAPPLMDDATTSAQAANARAFNNWLVDDWLAAYPHRNVAVFDFYNVLTSNGGNSLTNDLNSPSGNHHRWWEGAVQHIRTSNNNYLSYPTGDSHPAQAGNKKATGEFVELLNVYYHRWADEPTCTALTGVTMGGSTVGFTNTVYAFAATAAPVTATTPVTYAWAPAPRSGQGTHLATYSWPVTGTRTLTVTAINCGGTVTGAHAITVIPYVPPTDFVYLAEMDANP